MENFRSGRASSILTMLAFMTCVIGIMGGIYELLIACLFFSSISAIINVYFLIRPDMRKRSL